MTTLHISWSIHDDGGHFPTIRLRQSNHLTKCPAHSHINICSTFPPEFNRYIHKSKDTGNQIYNRAILAFDQMPSDRWKFFWHASKNSASSFNTSGSKRRIVYVCKLKIFYLWIFDSFLIIYQFPYHGKSLEWQGWKIYLKYLHADKMRAKVRKSELTPVNGP